MLGWLGGCGLSAYLTIQPFPSNPSTQKQEIVKRHVKGGDAGAKLSKEEVQNRLVSRFVNEAVFCLQVGCR